MSKQSKATKKNQRARRLALAPYLNERLAFTGRVRDFGKDLTFGLALDDGDTVCLAQVKTIDNLSFEHIWLKIPRQLREELKIGDEVSFTAKVIQYEGRKSGNKISYKYGLDFQEEDKLEVLTDKK